MITGFDNMIASLCAFDVRDDKLLRAFSVLSGESVSDAFPHMQTSAGYCLEAEKAFRSIFTIC